MRKERRPHHLFRASLYLYPKAYRREYGEQMVQTLDDLLAAAGTPGDRTAVWLRVGIELPFSVIKESINNIGENSMSKLSTVSNKRLRIGGITVALIVLSLSVGYWRDAALDGTANLLYGHGLRHLAVEQTSHLDNPFMRFAGRTPKAVSQCAVGPSDALRIHMDCGTTMQAYTKLGQSAADKAQVLNSVAAVTNALKAEGYQGGSNGVTLTSLVAGTYQGKDYSPDAFYQKVISKNTICSFDVAIGYANPAQPAINILLNCDRTFNIFGKPASQAYYR